MNTKNISYGLFAVVILALIVTSCSNNGESTEAAVVLETTPAIEEVVTPAVEEVVTPTIEEVVEPAVEEVVEPTPAVEPEVAPTEEGGDSEDTNTDSE